MKNKLFLLLIPILFIGCARNNNKDKENKLPYIEILDKEGLKLIDPKAEIKTLAGGFHWTEGPLWIDEGGYLLFSNIPSNKVYKMTPEGDTSVYLHPSGYTGTIQREGEPGSNALLLNPEGALILLQHGDRRVAKMEAPIDAPQPIYSTLTDDFDGKMLNSPNDGVFDTSGNLYFTDPPYGLPKGQDDPSKELSFQGVFCLMNSGELLLLDSLSRPNGMALSPDQSRLFVAVSAPEHSVWYSYDITAPGLVENRKLFYDVTELVGQEGQQGLPDGMKMHPEGYLFATGPGGVWIFNLEAKPLARIHTGQATSNCAFSADLKTLYLTADDFILGVGLK